MFLLAGATHFYLWSKLGSCYYAVQELKLLLAFLLIINSDWGIKTSPLH